MVDRLSVEIVKRIVASGMIEARFSGQNTFQYQPWMSPTFTVNHLNLASSDEAFWKRLRIVIFTWIWL